MRGSKLPEDFFITLPAWGEKENIQYGWLHYVTRTSWEGTSKHENEHEKTERKRDENVGGMKRNEKEKKKKWNEWENEWGQSGKSWDAAKALQGSSFAFQITYSP